MKLTTTPLYLLSFLLIPLFSHGSQDLFPVKSFPLYSKFWTVQYFDTYKIATNLATNTSYLLYQNGTQPPPSSQLDVVVIEIPLLGDIGVTETPTIPYLELLGVQTRVKAYLGDTAFIASPCFVQLINNGSIIDFTGNASNATALAEAAINASTLVTFVSYDVGGAALAKQVYITEYLETSNEAIYEWLKFYALFFNLEGDANRLCHATFARALCVEENAASITSDQQHHPMVLWAYYSTYAEGWSLATCPNYYCEFATACSATLLPATNGSILAYGDSFLTDDEFLQFGKHADYWIFPSNDWDTIIATKKSTLGQFTSVMKKQVFDNQGSGENAWFEEREAEYGTCDPTLRFIFGVCISRIFNNCGSLSLWIDVVIQDFCSVVGTYLPAPSNHLRVWFRNVFTEPVGRLGQCTNPSAPLQTPATECTPMSDSNTTTNTTGKTSAATSACQPHSGLARTLLLLLLPVALFVF